MPYGNRLIYGFGGVENFGDDYILKKWVEYYSRMDPSIRLFVCRPEKWLISFFVNQQNFRLFDVIETEFRKLMNYNLSHQEQFSVAIDTGKLVAENLTRFDSEYREFFRSMDCIHLIGGGYLNDIFPVSWGVLSVFSEISKKFDIPLLGTGLGLEPIPLFCPKIIDVMKQFSFLELRDDDSFRQISEILPDTNCVKGFDDSFIDTIDTQDQERRSTIFLSIQTYYNGNGFHDDVLKKINEFLERNSSQFDIGYVKFHDEFDDIFLNKMLKSSNFGVNVFSSRNILRNGVPFRSGDMCITRRFHFHLLAARMNVHGAYILIDDEYYRIKHNSVNDLGSSWGNLLDPEFSLDEMKIQQPSEIDDSALVSQKRAIVDSQIFF